MSDKRRNQHQAKAQASGLSQKAKQWAQEVMTFLSWANNTVGEKDRPNLPMSHKRNVVSP
jgi:hypothetical protein